MSTPTALVSVEDNDYCWWQMRLLRHSLKKRAPHVRLVAAVSCKGGRFSRGWHELCDHALVAPHYLDSIYAERDPLYYLWNKPLGLYEAVSRSVLADAGPLLLLDPDMVLLTDQPFGIMGTPGSAMGTLFNDLMPPPKRRRVLELCGPEAQEWCDDLFSPVGFPMVLPDAAYLKLICSEWIPLLETIQGNPEDYKLLNWWSEMWAFAGAAAKVGADIQVNHRWCVSTDHRGPLDGVDWLHYCNRALVPVDKRQHDPKSGAWLGMTPAAARLVKEWWEMEGA